jgi:hypothetical protein
MADHVEQAHAPAAAKPVEASREAEPGERHEALESRPAVRTEADYGTLLNARPVVAAQR